MAEPIGLARYSADERLATRHLNWTLRTGRTARGITIASRHPRFGASECVSAQRLHVVKFVAILWNETPRPLFGAAWTCGGDTTYPQFFDDADSSGFAPCDRCDFEGLNAGGPVVYYVRKGRRIKIGFSANLPVRLAKLGGELLACEPGGLALERRRQAQFADARIAGEWFRPTPRLLAYIAWLTEAVA